MKCRGLCIEVRYSFSAIVVGQKQSCGSASFSCRSGPDIPCWCLSWSGSGLASKRCRSSCGSYTKFHTCFFGDSFAVVLSFSVPFSYRPLYRVLYLRIQIFMNYGTEYFSDLNYPQSSFLFSSEENDKYSANDSLCNTNSKPIHFYQCTVIFQLLLAVMTKINSYDY